MAAPSERVAELRREPPRAPPSHRFAGPLALAGLRALLLVVAAACVVACGAPDAPSTMRGGEARGPGERAATPTAAPARIVSLVPSVTEMLFAIGAGDRIVGVSSFDTFPPEVQALPKVGGLVNPDTESILALRPDLVMVYGSQAGELTRFEAAGIRTFSYRHAGIEGTLQTIATLGQLTNRSDAAGTVVSDIRRRLAAVAAKVEGRTRPRTMLVFDRAPDTLQGMFASGGVGFMHEMLVLAGGQNALAETMREAVQPSHERLITSAPDVVLELSPQPRDADTISRISKAWDAVPALPAVRAKRIVFLSGSELLVPGPRLAQGTEAFARALHPEAFR